MKSSVLFYEKSVKKRQIWEGGVRGTFFNILKNEKKPCRNRVATFFGPPFGKRSKTPCLFDGG